MLGKDSCAGRIPCKHIRQTSSCVTKRAAELFLVGTILLFVVISFQVAFRPLAVTVGRYSSWFGATRQGALSFLPPAGTNRTAVLLVTYASGGSTFLGEAFNLNEDAFYWFEPLPGVYDKLYPASHERCRSFFCHTFHENGSVR